MAFLQQVDSNCVEICLLTPYCPLLSCQYIYTPYLCYSNNPLDSHLYLSACFLWTRFHSSMCISVYSNLFASVGTHFFRSYLLLLVADDLHVSHASPLLFVCCSITCPCLALVVCTCHYALLLICTYQKLSAWSRIADSRVDGVVTSICLIYVLRRSRVFGILLRSRHTCIQVVLPSIQLL